VLEVTALQRFSVFAFLAGSIATGALAARWTSVAATDLLLAALQVWMLLRWPTA
jgi:hypothetical protein